MPRKLLDFDAVQFATIDVETTGLHAGGRDRIVEIAIVRMDPARGAFDEYVTLVNPKRDVGPVNIHGIRASAVKDAPTFDEIAGDVAERLQDVVVVGHNVSFDLNFVDAEFARAGMALPDLPSICTMWLTRRMNPDAGRKLAHCCAAFGIPFGPAHSALHDARAAAMLFGTCMMAAKRAGLTRLVQLGCEPDVLPDRWSVAQPSGRVYRRSDVSARVAAEPAGFLADLLARVPPTPVEDTNRAAYMNALDRVLSDRIVTAEEADALLEVARTWGLQRSDVFEAHLAYLEELVQTALADHVVTPDERRDLDNVAALLGLHQSTVDASLDRWGSGRTVEIAARASRPTSTQRASGAPAGALVGLTVCFTGTFSSTKNGAHVTRAQAEAWASAAGMFVRQSVSKKLDLLVLDDVESQSGKAEKARQYGIRMMAAADFWPTIGVTVDGANVRRQEA